jgi:hypothetical protein
MSPCICLECFLTAVAFLFLPIHIIFQLEVLTHVHPFHGNGSQSIIGLPPLGILPLITSNTSPSFYQSHFPDQLSRTHSTITPRCLLQSRSLPRLLRRPKRIISHTSVTISVRNGVRRRFCATRTRCRQGHHPAGRRENK